MARIAASGGNVGGTSAAVGRAIADWLARNWQGYLVANACNLVLLTYLLAQPAIV